MRRDVVRAVCALAVTMMAVLPATAGASSPQVDIRSGRAVCGAAAYCIDLPENRGLYNIVLSLRNGGRTLAVHWRSGRPWLNVATGSWSISYPRTGFPWAWVGSGTGTGTTCLLASPCLSLDDALNQTTLGGTVTCLDPGANGQFAGVNDITINQSVTIDCEGASGHGAIVSINGPAGMVVTLRGLSITTAYAGDGTIGIYISAGATVNIEHCDIEGYTGGSGIGIYVAPQSGTAKVRVVDSVISNNGWSGGGAGLPWRARAARWVASGRRAPRRWPCPRGSADTPDPGCGPRHRRRRWRDASSTRARRVRRPGPR